MSATTQHQQDTTNLELSSLPWFAASADSVEQLRNRGLKTFGNQYQAGEGEIGFTTLNLAHVAGVEAAPAGKPYLGKSPLLSQLPDSASQRLTDLFHIEKNGHWQLSSGQQEKTAQIAPGPLPGPEAFYFLAQNHAVCIRIDIIL